MICIKFHQKYFFKPKKLGFSSLALVTSGEYLHAA